MPLFLADHLPSPTAPPDGHRVPLRVAAAYLLVGLAWVWATDAILFFAELQTPTGFLLSGGKGTLFFAATAILLYWLVRSHFRSLARGYALLRTVTDGTPDAVFVKDREGKYLLFNEAAARLVGKPISEVLGRDDTVLFDPSGAQLVMDRDRRVMATGTAETQEEELTAAGVTRTYLATKAPVRDQTGAVVGVFGISHEITDRKRAEEALREAQRMLRLVLDTVPHGVFWKDRESRHLGCNAVVARSLGFESPEQVIGLSDADLPSVTPEQAAAFARDDQEVMETGVPRLKAIEPLTMPDGRTVWLETSKLPLRDSHGTVFGVIGTWEDVTERKMAEEQVRLARHTAEQSLAQLRSVVSSLADGVVISDAAGNLLDWNPAALRMHGYASVEEVRRNVTTFNETLVLSTPEGRTLPLPDWPLSRLLRGETVTDEELVVRRTDTGLELVLRYSGSVVRGTGGGAELVVLALHDVTAHRRAQAEARRSEERARRGEALLSAVMDALPVSVIIADETGRLVRKNPVSHPIWGPAPLSENVAGYREYVGYWPETGRRIEPHEWPMARAVLNGETTTNVRVEIERFGDTARRQLELSAAPVVGEGGERLGGVVACQDVTERVAAEQALRESEARFRTMADAAPVLIWVAGLDKRCTWFNRRWLEFVGRGMEKESGDGWTENVHPDDYPRCMETYSTAFDARRSFTSEYRLRRRDGEYRWVFDTGTPRFDAAGTFAGYIGSCVDINDRRVAESSLRENEWRFRNVFENAPTGIGITDPVGRFLQCNPAYCRVLGRSEEELKVSDLASLIHPDDRAENMALLRKLAAGDIPSYEVENRFLHKSGEPMWVHKQVSALRDDSGKTTHLMALVTDVTQRRRAEQALRESEERLRLAVRAANLGLWDWNARTDHVIYSTEWKAQLGYADDEIGTAFAEWEDRVHPDDLQPTLELVHRTLTGETGTYEAEFRMRHKDGSWRWIYTRAELFRDAGGAPVRMLGGHIDVTDRKLTIERVRESEERFRTLIDMLPDAIFLNVGGRVAFCNPACVRLFGATAQGDLLGKTPFDLHPPAYHDIIRERIAFQRAERRPVPGIEEEALRLDGRTVPVFVTALPLANRGEEAILVVLRDLTEQKHAEARLRDQELLLREAGELAHMGGWGFDPVTLSADWTEEAARIHDLPAGEAPGVPGGIEFYAEADRPRLEAAVRAAIDQGRPYDLELRLNSARGTEKWVRTICRPVIEGGRVIRVRGSIQDITDRKRAEQVLRESEERFRTLVEVLPDAIYVNAGGLVSFCNPACVRLFGAPTDSDLLGRSPFELFTPEYHDAVRDRIEQMLRTGEGVPGRDQRIVRLDGRTVPVHVVAVPIAEQGRDTILVCLRDLSERERSLSLLRTVMGSVSDAILTIDARGRIESANPATGRLFGHSESELIGENVRVLMPEPDRTQHDGYIANFLRTGDAKVIGTGREVVGLRKDASRFPVELTVTEFRLDGERHFTGVLRDITARRRLEDQFRQAQKMEAVGRLAGGVAHDFNNLLTVINGFSDLLLMELPTEDRHRGAIVAVRDAGERAAALTSQLLAFSRKTIIAPKVFDLKDAVAQSEKLLRRLIGEDVVLTVVSHPHPCMVHADLNQIDQVIMNLAVNARDAMPTGGRLTLETRRVAAPARPEPPLAGAGHTGGFVELTVTDTGTGMPPEVRDRIFEPFFTTKGEGKGTGLGLATVYGIVTQAGGRIVVESAAGQGTTFRILLPEAAAPAAAAESGIIAPRRGTETVLLVEDDDAVRALSTIALETHGYTVLAASTGPAALDLLRTGGTARINILVSDVVMPQMSGRELADAARVLVPGLRVLFVSGYTDDEVFRHGVREATDAFLQKPFTPMGLARKVREVLDR